MVSVPPKCKYDDPDVPMPLVPTIPEGPGNWPVCKTKAVCSKYYYFNKLAC